MARKLQQKLQKVSVYIRIRLTDGSQPYCPAIWESKKRLRPHWCLVRGKPEHHPKGVYHVRYRVNGKPVWEKVCVGDDPYEAADLAVLRQSQLSDPHEAASQRLVDKNKPEPVEAGPAKHRLDDEVKTYLSNVAKLAPKTHAAYKLTLDLFQQSCSKPGSPHDQTNCTDNEHDESLKAPANGFDCVAYLRSRTCCWSHAERDAQIQMLNAGFQFIKALL